MAQSVLETTILHASDVIYWVDGTTASGEDDMLRLDHPVFTDLETRPTDLEMINSIGKTAFWRRSGGTVLPGHADEVAKSFPAVTLYTLVGTVSDPQGHYHSRRFNLNAGAAGGHTVVMYPTPLGTRFAKAGGLVGALRWNGSQLPVPWAILNLTVTTAFGPPMIFRSQSDGHGDFRLSIKQLPPLPEGISHYLAELTIEARADADPGIPIDPDDQLAMSVGDMEADTFVSGLSMQVVPGEIRLIRSLNKDHLSVQPS